MNDKQDAVKRWHEAFGHPSSDAPTLINLDRALLRFNLIQEELDEYKEAFLYHDLVEVADALGDLLFVVYGAAVEHGIDLEPIFEEIVSSNFSKLDDDGKPVPHPTIPNKIGKSANFREPDLAPILREQRRSA